MKLIQGVGVNDSYLCGPACYYNSEGRKVNYPDYEMWKGMILRCFSEKEKVRRSACQDSHCSEDWKHRFNFQKWYFSNKGFVANDGTKLHLDKDLLFVGNNLYSDETCCLIPHYLNMTVRDSSRARTPWVRQVPAKGSNSILKKPWRASVYNEGKHIELGFFSTEVEAHNAAQYCKSNVLLDYVIPKYQTERFCDDRVVDALVFRAELLVKQADAGEISRFC
jgi:hypothetical protein